MIVQIILPLFLGLVLISTITASNSTTAITNGTTECVPADRTKRSAVHTEPGVCIPYQSAFSNGYCKDIIGYLPVYGTDFMELQNNEDNMLRFRVAKGFVEQALKNSTEEDGFVVRQSCLDMVDDVYCHHYFKRCYISSRPPLICREACEQLYYHVCDREFKMVEDFMKSREGIDYPYYFDIINCTTLPFRNESSNCYYPDKIRDKLDVLKSEDCFYGDGRGYRGNRSVTVSGYTCQSWDAQCPHKHNINGKIYKSIEDSGNLCRNPGGFAKDGPWCFTTNRTVRWEYCDVPKCGKHPPSSPPGDFRGHNLSSTSIKVNWGNVPKPLVHGVLLGFHVACERRNKSDSHFVELSPVEHNWVFKGLQKYRNYSCWLRAYNNYGNGTWSKELVILTDEDVPDAPPESLKAWNLSSTSLHIQWDPIPFGYRNGKILRYKVDINAEKQTRERFKATKYTESTSLTLRGLQKYSKYKISVSGITRRGNGPFRSKVVQTDEDVPDRPPKDITAVSIGKDTVQVDWSPVPPGYTNGEVLGYQVIYSDVNETSRANSSLVSPKETHLRIKGLKANTNYSFQVLAFTAKGNGPKSMAYYARTFQDSPKKTIVGPSIDPGATDSAKVSIIVAAVFSGTVAFGAVFLVVYFVRKKRISSSSDSGNGCSVAPYAISSPDWLNDIINTHRHGYETIDDDNVPTTTRRPHYINIAADGSLDLPPHLKNIVTEFEQLYENTHYKRLKPYGRRRSLEGAVDRLGNPVYDSLLRVISPIPASQENRCKEGVQASATAKMERRQHNSVDLGELRGFIGALQGNASDMEMTEMGTVEQRCPRRFSVDMGQVREFIALREMKIFPKEEISTLADHPEAQVESGNDATC
ncbi:uncharacterized protein LOC144649949 isoform X2 [Oculina patagonica]